MPNEQMEDSVEEAALDYEEILAEYHRGQMRTHLVAPLVSLVVHVLVIFLAVVFLVGQHTRQAEEVEIFMEEMEIKELDPKVMEDLKELEQLAEDLVPTVEKPEVPRESVEVSTEDFSDEMAETDNDMDFSDVLDIKVSDTPLKISGLYGGRSSEGRKKQLSRYGGSGVTEGAVMKALRWLKKTQNQDGSWSKSQPDPMTGLGLLTFLAHGETPLSDEFGTTVQKAMQYLTDRMMPLSDEFLKKRNWPRLNEVITRAYATAHGFDKISAKSKGKKDPSRSRLLKGRSWPYVNGIMTYAVAEGYGLTKVPFLKPAVESGLGYILKGQQDRGGFNYMYEKQVRWDLSVTSWQIQAMKAAYVAGIQPPGLVEAMEKSISFLKNVSYQDGKFGYSSPGKGSWGMQGAGALCLQLLGEKHCAETVAVVENIDENHAVHWDKQATYSTHHNPAYHWYYETQAMFHGGTRFWHKWNNNFASTLVRNQQKDGHWDCPGKKTWKDKKKKGIQKHPEYDPWYTTCLCCLSLQVYYRYLPTYKMPKAASRKSASLLDEIDGLDLGIE